MAENEEKIRVDREINSVNIKKAILELRLKLRRFPTPTEISNESGIPYRTVIRHLSEYKFSDVQDVAKQFTEDIVAYTLEGARTDPRDRKLWYQFVEQISERKDVTSGGEKLAPVKIVVASEEDKENLNNAVKAITGGEK